nr:immunoglobulin heavy chain junction region [Mus musculus]
CARSADYDGYWYFDVW